MISLKRFVPVALSIALPKGDSQNKAREEKKNKPKTCDIHQQIMAPLDTCNEQNLLKNRDLYKTLDIHAVVIQETEDMSVPARNLNISRTIIPEQGGMPADTYDPTKIPDDIRTISELWNTMTHDDLNFEPSLAIHAIKLMLDKEADGLSELLEPILLPQEVQYKNHSKFFIHSFKHLIKDKDSIDKSLARLKRIDRGDFIKYCEQDFDTHEDKSPGFYLSIHLYQCIQDLKSLKKDSVKQKITPDINKWLGYDKNPQSNEEAIARFMEYMLERYKCEAVLRKYVLYEVTKKIKAPLPPQPPPPSS